MKKLTAFFESVGFGVLGMILGAFLAGIASKNIAGAPYIKQAMANIILDVTLIASQYAVIRLNKWEDPLSRIGFRNEKKTRPLMVGLIFAGAGLVVLISYLILGQMKVMGFVGSGFGIFQAVDVVVFTVVLFIQMLFVAVAEEIMFRGVMQTELVNNIGKPLGVIVATLVFTLFHTVVFQSFTQVTDILLLGLILGLLYLKTGNIHCSIAFHFGIDFFTNLVGTKYSTALFVIDVRRSEMELITKLFGIMSVMALIILIGWGSREMIKKKAVN